MALDDMTYFSSLLQNLLEEDQADQVGSKKSPEKEKQHTPPSISAKTSLPPSNVQLSSSSSHESRSVEETVISSNSETKMTATESISKAAISEIVVTVPQEVVWKEEVCRFPSFDLIGKQPYYKNLCYAYHVCSFFHASKVCKDNSTNGV